jgi:hypothetical protein
LVSVIHQLAHQRYDHILRAWLFAALVNVLTRNQLLDLGITFLVLELAHTVMVKDTLNQFYGSPVRYQSLTAQPLMEVVQISYYGGQCHNLRLNPPFTGGNQESQE